MSDTPHGSPPAPRGLSREWEMQRALVWCLVVGVALALACSIIFASDMLLVAFAGLLLAIIIHESSNLLARYTGLSHLGALALVVVGMIFAVALGLIYLIPIVAEQLKEFQQALPKSLAHIRDAAERQLWSRWLIQQLPANSDEMPTQDVWAGIMSAVSASINVLFILVLVPFIGVLLVVQPYLYRNGFIKLLPPPYRARGRDVLEAMAHSLRWWLVSRAIAMTAIGSLTWIGLFALGLPFAFTLALTAAVLAFIPYFGFIISMIPALATGFAHSSSMALFVLVLYCAIQALETYVITPWAQYKAARLPPALSIVNQLVLAILFGPIGFILADPLLLVGMVGVQKLYIEGILEDTAASET
jgi:predicted PurR-regulated permease PerM